MANKLTDVNDVKFVLYEQLQIEELCNSEKFGDHSRETFDMILDAAEKLAVNDFQPVNGEGDELGCTWKDGIVKVPGPFHAPYRKFCEGGWLNMAETYDVGGQGVPLTIDFACKEMMFAACHSLIGYTGLTHSAAKVIERYGTEEQKKKYMGPLYEGRYGGGMNLTEAQAGSDVGAVRTKAFRNPDGTYRIEGGKIFITGGDTDLTENIVHIILARIEGDPEGTKGLTCFIVPKIRVNGDGSLGEPNDVVCAGIEHKMGMRGSATCVLKFGENGRCIGERIGPERKGIVVMFTMMNEQRALVGMQGLAQGSTAYLHALEFARERHQGSKFGSKDPRQVPIIRHPDVKRNILWMKALTEGMRALVFYVMYCMDRMESVADGEEKSKWQSLVEVLTPVCKAYCTDKGFDVCVRAIQVHGGYGYCKEYKVEQFARDCKITSIYEGTNGIQSLDLFGRKIRMADGAALAALLGEMETTVEEASRVSALKSCSDEVGRALEGLKGVTAYLRDELSSKDPYLAYSWATPYLELFGDVVLGWLLLWQAKVASDGNVKTGVNGRFYANKVATAKFYIGSILPVVYGKIQAVMKGDRSLVETAEEITAG
jgi:alkylation response protein AidB-like acyl-CoA dehydrogenase